MADAIGSVLSQNFCFFVHHLCDTNGDISDGMFDSP